MTFLVTVDFCNPDFPIYELIEKVKTEIEEQRDFTINIK